eukprot:TRINITY_DN67788_c0_g1_i1.p1 TRINITY_DN67788_c0_g1~~TRINITY_DN67788_c0_g1_i1.p1  ORF type:complete len:1026 (+),score=207.36 TRINITY_DN67788_c0_g1_i1:67-3144(+)
MADAANNAFVSLDGRRMSSEDGGNMHEAIAYLVVCLVLGVATYHVLSRYRGVAVPYTVALFLEGQVVGIMHTWLGGHHWNTLSHSITMWTSIDYHVLLYTFLPCLLFGDSLSVNWCLWKRCLTQCLLLAGPGVLIGAGITAVVAHYVLPYGWSWSTCLTFASIVSATDPVAVVGLLKQMGASRVLTMQIAGESLLNDGFAIVLWATCFKAMVGEPVGIVDFVKTFLRLAVGGVVGGWLVGSVTLSWLTRASDKMRHEDHVIQISLTIACAYFTFFFMENDLQVSGVLAVVSGAVCISRAAWPLFTDHKGLVTVWHTIEFVGNTVVFFLAGTITGSIMGDVDLADYGWLLVTYVSTIAARGTMIAMLFPALQRMGPGLTWKDSMVMVWGGLRGAVGLALAIAVDKHEAVDRKTGTKIIFHVSGLAGLTLLINATTAGQLLRLLGMTRRHAAHIEMVNALRRNLRSIAKWSYLALSGEKKFENHDRSAIKRLVTVLADVECGEENREMLGAEMQKQVIRRHEKTVQDLSRLINSTSTLEGEFSRDSTVAIGSGDASTRDTQSGSVDDTFVGELPSALNQACSSCDDVEEVEEAVGRDDDSISLSSVQATPSPRTSARGNHRLTIDTTIDPKATRATSTKLSVSSAVPRSSTVRRKMASIELVAGEVVEMLRHTQALVRGLTREFSVRNSIQEGLDVPDELCLQTERELFLSVLQATYWKFLEEGLIPSQSQATTVLLRSVDAARMRCHETLADGAALVGNLLRGNSSRKSCCGKVMAWLARTLDGDNIGFMIVPCEYKEHDKFDLFALVSFIDAHEQTRKAIKQFHQENQELANAREQVLRESRDESSLIRQFLSDNSIGEAMVRRVRTKQLGFCLLHQQKVKVNEWLNLGVIDCGDAQDLLSDVRRDSEKMLRPWSSVVGDLSRGGTSLLAGANLNIGSLQRLCGSDGQDIGPESSIDFATARLFSYDVSGTSGEERRSSMPQDAQAWNLVVPTCGGVSEDNTDGTDDDGIHANRPAPHGSDSKPP